MSSTTSLSCTLVCATKKRVQVRLRGSTRLQDDVPASAPMEFIRGGTEVVHSLAGTRSIIFQLVFVFTKKIQQLSKSFKVLKEALHYVSVTWKWWN